MALVLSGCLAQGPDEESAFESEMPPSDVSTNASAYGTTCQSNCGIFSTSSSAGKIGSFNGVNIYSNVKGYSSGGSCTNGSAVMCYDVPTNTNRCGGSGTSCSSSGCGTRYICTEYVSRFIKKFWSSPPRSGQTGSFEVMNTGTMCGSGGYGFGKTWAKNKGWRVKQPGTWKPRTGDVVVWRAGGNGHTAIVRGYNLGGSMVVANQNSTTCNGTTYNNVQKPGQTISYNSSNNTVGSFQGVAHACTIHNIKNVCAPGTLKKCPDGVKVKCSNSFTYSCTGHGARVNLAAQQRDSVDADRRRDEAQASPATPARADRERDRPRMALLSGEDANVNPTADPEPVVEEDGPDITEDPAIVPQLTTASAGCWAYDRSTGKCYQGFTPRPAAVDHGLADYSQFKNYPGDFNGDGKMDMAVAKLGYNDGWYAKVNRSNGDGTLAAAPTINGNSIVPIRTTGFAAGWRMYVGDYDGDGRTDLMAVNPGAAGGKFSGYLAKYNDDGTFTPGTEQVFAATGFDSTWAAATADINGDGKHDFVAYLVGANTGLRIAVALSNGNGTFTYAGVKTIATTGYPAGWAYRGVDDINGDDFPDFTVAWIGQTGGAFKVRSAIGDGLGGFTAVGASDQVLASSGFLSPWRTDLEDINNDGAADVVAQSIGPSGWFVRVAFGNYDGIYTLGAMQTITTTAIDANWTTTIRDVDGDGIGDALGYRVGDSQGAWRARVAQSVGDGTFVLKVEESFATTGYPTGWTPFFADYTGDGRLDIGVFYTGATGYYENIAILAPQ